MATESDTTLTLALTGDVMLGRGVDVAVRRHGPAYPWGDLLPDLRAADLTIINLECVISQAGQPWSRWPKVFHFHAAPLALETLGLAGVDAVTLANNHVLDWEEEALLEMLERLRQRGIAFTGAGRNADEAQQPALLRRRGVTVAVLGFTDNEPGWAAKATTPGVNWIEIGPREEPLQRVRDGITQARAAGADLVILSLHWGPNMVQRPSAEFRAFAHAAISVGADLIHGHSAHVFQGIEVYHGRPILYDTGDFVDDYAVDPELRNDWSFLYQVQVQASAVRRIECLPVRLGYCQVNRAGREEAAAIAARLLQLSAEMGTILRWQGGRVWLECGEP